MKINDKVKIKKSYVFPTFSNQFNYNDDYIIIKIKHIEDKCVIQNNNYAELTIDIKHLEIIESNNIVCKHEFIDVIGFNGRSLGKSCKLCDIKEEDCKEELSIDVCWDREYYVDDDIPF